MVQERRNNLISEPNSRVNYAIEVNPMLSIRVRKKAATTPANWFNTIRFS